MKERGGATVIIIDGGGRGSVLAESYSKNPYVRKIIAVPGNDAMSLNTGETPVELHPELKTINVKEIVNLALEEARGDREVLVDVAQDNAVAVGAVDALAEIGVPVVGPTRAAGEIEWSKTYQRKFGQAEGILQPSFKACQTEEEGIAYIESQPDQAWFIKADGLAEGKGVLPAKNNREAIEKIRELKKRFPEAAHIYLIEQCLQGDTNHIEEFSGYAISDGAQFRIVGFAEDHKRVNNHDARDEGENTGGMGCNTLVLPPDLLKKVEMGIFKKTFEGLAARGRSYRGVLYLGGMVVKQNGERNPYVIELNARWGDPEAEIVVPSLVVNLFEAGMAIAQGDISRFPFETDGKARVVVAGASRGYPGDYTSVRRKEIFRIDDARKEEGITIYGAGMKIVEGRYFASGGRLFYVVAEGKTVAEAHERAYEAMHIIKIEDNGLHYRTDIGWRAIQRETTAA